MKHAIKKRIMMIIPLGTIVIVLLGYFIPTGIMKPTENKKWRQALEPKEMIFEVKTSRATKGDLITYINTTGTVKAVEDLEITSNVSGVVKSVLVSTAQAVRKGELLLRLEDNESQIAYNDALARLEEAKIQYVINKIDLGQSNFSKEEKSIREEIRALEDAFRQNKMSAKEYEIQKTELETRLIASGAEREKYIMNRSGLTSAKNNLERASLNLSYTIITAPFDGSVTDCMLIPGKRINSGDKLLRLVNDKKLMVEANVLENESVILKEGSLAELSVNGIPGKKFRGYVKSIDPVIDTESRTCKVIAFIINGMKLIKPGMHAMVKLSCSMVKSKVLIPRSALLERDNRKIVFVADNGAAQWRFVKCGMQNEEQVVIEEGVEAGEDVIVEGHLALSHNSKIKISN